MHQVSTLRQEIRAKKSKTANRKLNRKMVRGTRVKCSIAEVSCPPVPTPTALRKGNGLAVDVSTMSEMMSDSLQMLWGSSDFVPNQASLARFRRHHFSLSRWLLCSSATTGSLQVAVPPVATWTPVKQEDVTSPRFTLSTGVVSPSKSGSCLYAIAHNPSRVTGKAPTSTFLS